MHPWCDRTELRPHIRIVSLFRFLPRHEIFFLFLAVSSLFCTAARFAAACLAAVIQIVKIVEIIFW